MDWMAVGFFHLLALGLFSLRANSVTTCWRKNICFVRLLFFFSVYCVFSGDKPVKVKFFANKMLVEINKSPLCVPPDKFLQAPLRRITDVDTIYCAKITVIFTVLLNRLGLYYILGTLNTKMIFNVLFKQNFLFILRFSVIAFVIFVLCSCIRCICYLSNYYSLSRL